MRIAAISDLHLGTAASYLTLGSVRERLIRELDHDGSDLDCLFIVGDLMDLAAGQYPEPWLATKEFLAELDTSLPNLKKIVYLPGNHDHHVWTLVVEFSEILKKLPDLKRDIYRPALDSPLTNNCYPFHTPLHSLFPPRLRPSAAFSYPFHIFVHKGTRFIFHHGHYFDPAITPFSALAVARGDLKKVEAVNLPYIEALFYLFSWDPLVQRAELGCYDKLLGARYSPPFSWILNLWRKWKGGGGDGPPKSTLKRIEAMMWSAGLRNQNLAERDVWVFGHTHRHGSWTIDERMSIHDLGGWVLNHDPRKGRENACSVPVVFRWSDKIQKAETVKIEISAKDIESLANRAFPLGG